MSISIRTGQIRPATCDRAEPASVRLRADSEPVILRMHPGITLAVTVLEQTAVTDAAGVAELRGIGARRQRVDVDAEGYAPGRGSFVVPDDPGGQFEQTVELARGARVSGVVLTPDGKGQPAPRSSRARRSRSRRRLRARPSRCRSALRGALGLAGLGAVLHHDDDLVAGDPAVAVGVEPLEPLELGADLAVELVGTEAAVAVLIEPRDQAVELPQQLLHLLVLALLARAVVTVGGGDGGREQEQRREDEAADHHGLPTRVGAER